jgi:hypothetical protein
VIAEECNRVFAKEKLVETWECLQDINCPPGMSRLYLTHYPVKRADLESVKLLDGTILDPLSYRLEERSGKLTISAALYDVSVTYAGGYTLPDEAPLPLQQATALLVQKGKITQQQSSSGATSGIRMIVHKGARITYFSPKDMTGGSTTSGGTPSSAIESSVKSLLYNFIRHWV